MIINDIVLVCFMLVMSIVLFLLAGYAEKNKNSKFRMIYLLAFILGIVIAGTKKLTAPMAGAYIAAVVLGIGFFVEKKKARQLSTFIAIALTIISAGASDSKYYRPEKYSQDFTNVVKELRTHYVLAEEKGIDFDALYEKYLPEFKKAENDYDKVYATESWLKFINEFHDMHVSFMADDDSIYDQAMTRLCGNDYGLSIMELEDGSFVAVNVDEAGKAAEAGITNGTKLLKWDNLSINEQKDNVEYEVINYAVDENREFFKAIFVAGLGADQVEVTFVDEDNNEKNVTLTKMGSYWKRARETFEMLDKGTMITNLTWKDVDDNTTLLRLGEMGYDAKANSSQDYSNVMNALEKTILEKKEQGFNYLILDLRSNGGGSGDYVKLLASLLAPEGEHVYAYDGKFDLETCTYEKDSETGRYVKDGVTTYVGKNLWSHGRILLLVNAETVSAGDHFTRLMSDFDNVTVMGFTTSSCSAQGVTMTESCCGVVTYSEALLLNEDGTVFIDTDKTGEATIKLDEKIAFDQKAVNAIFNAKEDYVLNYALDYLQRLTE